MSNRNRLPTGLPLLPGNTFHDPRVRDFSKPQTLRKHVTGFQEVRGVPEFALGTMNSVARGSSPLGMSTAGSSSSQQQASLGQSNPQLELLQSIKARTQSMQPHEFQMQEQAPNLQGKVLIFYGFFKESVHESAVEQYRVRPVRFLYYLEDDTMEIIEQNEPNSGISQGHFLKRHRVPIDEEGTPVHFSDLNVGEEITLYGRVFHLTDADAFTREFFEAMGIDVPPAEQIPHDIFRESRKTVENKEPRGKGSVRDDPLKRYVEARLGRPTHLLGEKDKFQKFLANDRKVLKFFAQWKEDGMYGSLHNFMLLYFLADDTMQIIDLNRTEGKDPSSNFLKRQRFPKSYEGPGDFGEFEPNPSKQYYRPSDLIPGREINCFGRTLLINDCEEATKRWLRDNLGVTQFETRYYEPPAKPSRTQAPPPPHNGFGTEEDSLQNTKRIFPKAPKKDIAKLIANDKKILRFKMVFENPRAEDKDREFVLQFFLADDTVQIVEKKVRNSGFEGGVFLRRSRPRKNPTTELMPEYFKADDFHLGMPIQILGHRFKIVDADEYTLNFISGNPDIFSGKDLNTILEDVRQKLYLMRHKIRDAFRDVDLDKNGEIDLDEFRHVLVNFGYQLPEQELLFLFREFDLNGSGTITYDEFVEQVLDKDITHPALPRAEPTQEVKNLTNEQFKERVDQAKFDRFRQGKLRSILRNLRDIIFLKRALFTEALTEFDPNHTGLIRRSDFIHGVQKFGVQLSEDDFAMLLNHIYDQEENKGGIPYKDFLDKLGYYGKGLEGPRY